MQQHCVAPNLFLFVVGGSCAVSQCHSPTAAATDGEFAITVLFFIRERRFKIKCCDRINKQLLWFFLMDTDG